MVRDLSRYRNDKVVDEFYSGYIYTGDCDGTTISSAEFVEGMEWAISR